VFGLHQISQGQLDRRFAVDHSALLQSFQNKLGGQTRSGYLDHFEDVTLAFGEVNRIQRFDRRLRILPMIQKLMTDSLVKPMDRLSKRLSGRDRKIHGTQCLLQGDAGV
jgi:hypothetical protein